MSKSIILVMLGLSFSGNIWMSRVVLRCSHR